MFQQSFGRGWNSLTQGQKVFVVIAGALVLYGVVAMFAQGGGLFGVPNMYDIFAKVAIILLALPLHEFAHAFAAVKLGDPTPRLQGRYTLNPIAHLDLVGTLMIVFTPIGWAKPVQWNPNNIRGNPKLGRILVAVAGPTANLLLAIVGLLLVRVLLFMFMNVFGNGAGPMNIMTTVNVYETIARGLEIFVQINVVLFVFNLMPIPPLDGSHILFSLLPGDLDRLYNSVAQFGFMLVFGIAFLAPNVIWVPVDFVLGLLIRLILPNIG